MARIILPTDFSTNALNAARFAFMHFGGARSKGILVHAYATPSTDIAFLPEFIDKARTQAAKDLVRFKRKCTAYAGKATLAKVVTSTWLPAALDEVARTENAQLIIMGAHGAGDSALMGNATNAVVAHAALPTIIVPRQWTPAPIERILFAHDGGPLAKETMEPLVALAKRKKATIIVAHVRTNTYAFDHRADRAAMKKLLGVIPHSFVTAQGEDVARTIDELASDGRIQVVASVHRVRGFWKGLMHRSRAKRMALHTTIPLLVMRQAR